MRKRTIVLLNVIVAIASVLITYGALNGTIINHKVYVMPENNGLGAWHLYDKPTENIVETIDWGTMQPETTQNKTLYLIFTGGAAVEIKNLTISWNWYVSGPVLLRIWFASAPGVEFQRGVTYSWKSNEVWTLRFELTIVSGTVFSGKTEVNFAQIFTVNEAK